MSLLTSGHDTVTFVLADIVTDSDGNQVRRVGSEQIVIADASVTPIGSTTTVGADSTEGQPERATASVVTKPFEADGKRLYYGHVLYDGATWVMDAEPRFYHRSPRTAHWSFSIREVSRG